MAPNAFNNNPQETTTFFKLTILFTLNSSYYEKIYIFLDDGSLVRYLIDSESSELRVW